MPVAAIQSLVELIKHSNGKLDEEKKLLPRLLKKVKCPKVLMNSSLPIDKYL